MSRDLIFDLSMMLALVMMLIVVVMMIGTTIYLNRSSNRFRIFELGYSRHSDWHKSGKVDFFTANYVMSHMVLASLKMRGGWGSLKARTHGSSLVPYLHLDKGYMKLLEEFPFFVWWEMVKLGFGLGCIFFGLIGYGMKSEWW